jgi:predicted DNA repair protein MutK
VTNPSVDLVALERDKIKGAVRTDFILSAEIIAITLGTVQSSPFLTQLLVLTGIALLMTGGVYGLVAGIVKLDDAGLYLSRRTGTGGATALLRSLGHGILATAPWLMKALSVVGTAAMFLVGGGILTHGIPPLHHAIEALALAAPGVLGALLPTLMDGLVGIVAGALVLGGFSLVQRLRR